jgi:hypothetical protein
MFWVNTTTTTGRHSYGYPELLDAIAFAVQHISQGRGITGISRGQLGGCDCILTADDLTKLAIKPEGD